VRGQAMVCLSLAAFYGVALTVAGLEAGLLIGLATGILAFIPFVGAMIGFLLSVGVALAQWWPDYTHIGIVLGIFMVGQVLEGYVLTPRLVGSRIGLHPVWVMFALLAGGALFGFVGMLLSLPMFAAIAVLVRFGLNQYLDSAVYRGGPRP
jgi:predicted PurR-regulated permease PerM